MDSSKNEIINEHIHILLEAQNLIKKFYDSTNHYDIMNIHEYLNIYIQSNCIHDYIEDYIDINPDKTIKIMYCTKCLKMKK